MNYNEFVEQLKEGLILTHDITRYSSVITDFLSQLKIKYDINIKDKLEFELTIHLNLLPIEFPYNDVVSMINHRCYVLGYFPSYYWITLKNGIKNEFKEIINLTDNTKDVCIKFEAKYEDGLYTNNVYCPDKLYHLSYQDYKNKIIKNGLYPKSKNRLSVHPDRIYLFKDIDKYIDLLYSLKFSDKINNISKDYILLEIDCRKYPLILHTDPNYRVGYFTYDHINPVDIKFLKENL